MMNSNPSTRISMEDHCEKARAGVSPALERACPFDPGSPASRLHPRYYAPLRASGFNLFTAQDGAEAARMAPTISPQFMILDLTRADSVVLLQTLQKDRRPKDRSRTDHKRSESRV